MAGDTHGNNISKKCTIIVSVRQSQGNGYMILILFPDNGARLHMASCTEQEAEIYMPFCHREYNENEKLAKERFHVHERIWGDEKSWEDPDYPFDWTEGEFC